MKNVNRIAMIMVAAVLMVMIFTMVGCNKQVFDTTHKFDRAIIYLPNGEIIDGEVDSWLDFENSDQIQVKIDGVTYLVHSTNIVLIREK